MFRQILSYKQGTEFAHHPLVMIGSAIVQAEALGLGIRMLFKYMTET